MGIGKPLQDLFEQREGLFIVERPLAPDERVERRPPDVFHDDEGIRRLVVVGMHGQDVGMIQALRASRPKRSMNASSQTRAGLKILMARTMSNCVSSTLQTIPIAPSLTFSRMR